MSQNLVQHDDGFALIIQQPILDQLQIKPDTPLELTTNGGALVITPVRDASRRDQLQANLDTINEKYGDDLKRLAE